jgi:hypothetical protein
MNINTTQKVDHLKKGDLICVHMGYSHKMIVAVFINATAYSISFIREYSGYQEHIRTRNSTTQRVWKITEDNVDKTVLEWRDKIVKLLN